MFCMPARQRRRLESTQSFIQILPVTRDTVFHAFWWIK